MSPKAVLRPRRRVLARLALLAALLVSACQADTSPTATPVTSLPATTAAQPTPTSAAAATPTALPAPPVVATDDGAAPAPPPAATAGSDPLPTPPIPGVIGPGNIPAGVNPLTGLTPANPEVLNRRPLAVKISNYPPLVRPQSGLNSADLVFEHYAEGGVTRFTAVFYSRDAATVGSIRSGRLIDLEIPVMYDAAFAYSGASGPVREMIRNSAFFPRVISPDFGHGGFYRSEDPSKPFEHTLFTSTEALRFILDQRGLNVPPVYPTTMAFSEAIINAAVPVSTIELQYRATNAFWQYNPSDQRYYRWTDGVIHSDALTGTQLNFRNVIVLGANHVDTDILEDLVGGGNYSIQIQIWGEGPVSIFRDGQRIEGRWVRSNSGDMVTFYDLNGQVLPLAPGNSFVQLVPLGFSDMTTTP